MSETSDLKPSGAYPVGMLAVLWLIGWTLRVPILAAPPLATRIADSYGLGEAGIGALTMLPVVTVAFGAIPAAWVIGRFGLRPAIVGGITAMAVFSLARGFAPSTMTLFAASAIMGLGVSLFQTALPAATRVWTPTHVALGSAVYLNGMMMGELSGAGLTLPIVLPIAGGDWRFALAVWSIPILLIAALVAFKREQNACAEDYDTGARPAASTSALPRWNDARVWQYGLLYAGAIVTFFVINAFAGSVLRARGESDLLGLLLFSFNATPLLASFAVLAMPKWIGWRGPIALSAFLAAAGLAGFFFLDGKAAWGAALVTGFASTVELILLISLPATIATGNAVTRLSAGMTLIGFGLAFMLPLIGGWIADQTGRTDMALMPSMVFAVVVLGALGRHQRYPDYP